MDVPAWARNVIPGPAGAPLLYAGQVAGRPAAVLTFLPRKSDLPLQVAFPVLLANLAGELMGGSATPADAVAPGTPVTLAIPAGALGVQVERPDGSTDQLLAPVAGAASVTFARTDLLGVYRVSPIADPNPSPSPAGSAGATPSAVPTEAASAGPSSSASSAAPAPTFRPADPNAPTMFAVDLLDVDESNIAPGDPAKLTALGKLAASPNPSAGTGTAGIAAAKEPAARDELWIPIVLIALLVLTAEWLVYERDTVSRLRRRVVGRVRGGGAA
jgi:hypothetical protein